MKTLVMGMAMLALAGSAQAEEPVQVTNPEWLKRPSGEDLIAVWPREAWRKGEGGFARLDCKISLQGLLFDCLVKDEKPEGSGFGQAAIALTPQFLLKPGTRDGKPVVGRLILPIKFEGVGVLTGSHLGGPGTRALPQRSILANVSWRSAPTYDDVVAAYPAKARAGVVGGKAVLDCTIRDGGKLDSCKAVSEEPKGQGFGVAAKSLAPRFLAPTAMSDGSSTKGLDVQIPVVFGTEMLDPAKRLIGKPQWAALPNGGDVAAGYPVAAVKAGVREARVMIACRVVDEGRLGDCAVQSEEPPALGFGDAAMALSKSFQVRPWTQEGLPTVGGMIRVPIRYQLPQTPKAPQ